MDTDRYRLKQVRGVSIATLVVVAIVAVATLVLSVFGVVNYRSERAGQWDEFRAEAKADADQLATALALPLWNFDRPQIDRVIDSIMKEPIVAGVRLRIDSAHETMPTWVRSADGGATKVDGGFATNGLWEEVRTVKASPDSVLGAVHLFVSSEALENDLRQMLMVTIGRILAVDVVLTLGLYLVLWQWVLKPLRAVEGFAAAVSSGSAANQQLGTKRFQGELESLRKSIGKTFGELELRLTEKERAQGALRRQVALDELITRLMEGFVSASPIEIDGQIVASLGELARFVGAESGIVIQVSPNGDTWSVTHEWCAPGIGSRMGKFQNVPRGGSPWIENQLESDEPVAISSIDELPLDAKEERLRWEKAGVRSILHVPLRARGGRINGTLSLVSFSREMLWPAADISQVRILSNAIANTSERKSAEEAVLQSRAQLRALTGRLQSMREEERTRLSREIHDHLGQLLTALTLDLKSVERKVVAVQDAEVKRVLTNKLVSAQKLADEILSSIQKIASELRPGALDRLGLGAAIQSEAAAFQARTGVHCECHIVDEPLPQIGQAQATAAFRIFQELMTNVARHAKAKNTRVRLALNAGRLVLEVRDDGVGIPTSDIDNPKSLGILGVQERATLLGGTVALRGEPGKGTTVVVTIPCAEAV